jgi:hypothetical protein
MSKGDMDARNYTSISPYFMALMHDNTLVIVICVICEEFFFIIIIMAI